MRTLTALWIAVSITACGGETPPLELAGTLVRMGESEIALELTIGRFLGKGGERAKVDVSVSKELPDGSLDKIWQNSAAADYVPLPWRNPSVEMVFPYTAGDIVWIHLNLELEKDGLWGGAVDLEVPESPPAFRFGTLLGKVTSRVLTDDRAWVEVDEQIKRRHPQPHLGGRAGQHPVVSHTTNVTDAYMTFDDYELSLAGPSAGFEMKEILVWRRTTKPRLTTNPSRGQAFLVDPIEDPPPPNYPASDYGERHYCGGAEHCPEALWQTDAWPFAIVKEERPGRTLYWRFWGGAAIPNTHDGEYAMPNRSYVDFPPPP